MPHSLLTALLVAALARLLDVNTADPAALRGTGFTESQAAQIVRYRTENGAFLQVDELLAVPQVSKAALAPLRALLTIGTAPAAAAVPVAVATAATVPVRIEGVTAEWRNLYGVIVYAVNASLVNTGPQPLHAMHVRVDVLDAQGTVVATSDTYNLGAEGLLTKPDTALGSLQAIAPGGHDPMRLTIDKTDIPRPFATTRLTVVDAR
jgi:Helix-hairpin-helix motif